jgi:hypothetical protein
MKNKIYYFGIISCLLILMGCIFKIQHWSGAGVILSLSFPLFSLVFMPMALVNSYRSETDRKVKGLYIIAYICILIVITGALFKIQRWPGAGYFMVLSIPLPFALFLPAYLIYVNRDKQLNYNNMLLVMFFFAYFGAITALLSVNVNKNIIDESIIASYNQEQNIKQTNDQTLAIMDLLSTSSGSDSVKQCILNIKEKSDNLCVKIDQLKAGIVKLVDGKYQQVITAENNINLWKIKGKDNRLDIKDAFEGNIKEIETNMNAYRELILSDIKETDIETITYVKHLLDTQETPLQGDRNIFGMPIVFIIQSLELIKKDIALATYEAVSAIEESKNIN